MALKYKKRKLFIALVCTICIIRYLIKYVGNSPKENFLRIAVHLDLKGAPPKIEYLFSFLKIIKEYGADAVLMEYEDTFPFEGELAVLKGRNYYSKDQLKEFLLLANELKIEIIPLVQTFGHLQFVLKHDKYIPLRETLNFSNCLCPSKEDSKALIEDMLTQVIQFHQETMPLNHIHVGCDEVDEMNKCDICRNRLQSNINIFVTHVKMVTAIVKELSQNTTVLIWNDMLESITSQELSSIPNIDIDSVVWSYKAHVSVSHLVMYIIDEKFSNIWIASAFKGADGPKAILPIIENRVMNTLSWLSIVDDRKKVHAFKGIILTGWSRYNHVQPICELLPSAMHSLIINLITLKTYEEKTKNRKWNISFSKLLCSHINQALSCHVDSFRNRDFTKCKFQGSELYAVLKNYTDLVEKFKIDIRAKAISLYKNVTHVKVKHVAVKYLKNKRNLLLIFYHEIVRIMDLYYDKSIIEEYVTSLDERLLSSVV